MSALGYVEVFAEAEGFGPTTLEVHGQVPEKADLYGLGLPGPPGATGPAGPEGPQGPQGVVAYGAVAPETSFSGASADGILDQAARTDHRHGTPPHGDLQHSQVSLSALALPLTAVPFGGFRAIGVGNPTLAQDAATKSYVDASVAGLVDTAPTALDTLNELAAALGDDPNYAATMSGQIGSLDTRTDSLEADTASLGTRTSALESDTAALDTRAGTLESDVSALDTRVGALEAAPAPALKYAVTLTTSATSYTVTHNLGTADVTVSVRELATGALVSADQVVVDPNSISIRFAVAPAANAYRVTVIG